MQDRLFIDGTWQASKSGEMFDVVDPSNREVFHRVARRRGRGRRRRCQGGAQCLRHGPMASDARRRTGRCAAQDGRRDPWAYR